MKKHAPATARNSEALAAVLAKELPSKGRVLEVASGTGEHAVHMAQRFPGLEWQPTDPDAEARASIEAWREDVAAPNILPGLPLDARSADWPIDAADAIVCVNMVHISPWSASEGLFAGAARILGSEAPLVLYGPYLEKDVETATSNLAFDASLRDRDSEWGLRDTADMDTLAARHGFERTAKHVMPANNLTLVYRMTSDSKTPAG